MKLLVHPSDRRTLIGLAVVCMFFVWTLTLQLDQSAQLAPPDQHEGWGWFNYLIYYFMGAHLVFVAAMINHNHRHCPSFVSARLNRMMNVILSLCMGAPSGRLHYIHTFNHHKYYKDDRDLSRFTLNARGRGFFRLVSYLFLASWNMQVHMRTAKVPEALDKEIKWEKFFLYLFSAIALLINWKAFLFLIVPSWLLGLMLLLAGNLADHDHCELGSEFNHSRHFLNGIENWIFFNNGYHGIHHLYPNAHWSLLPELYQKQYQEKVDRQYVHNSFFGFLLRNYLFANVFGHVFDDILNRNK